MKVPVIYENNDVIITNKPAGLLVHPTKRREEDTLIDWLINKYPEIKNVGEDKSRPGIVHRLDRDTSGLIVIAKNKKIFSWLKNQFKNRLVKKRYLALVVGKLKDKKGIITKSISRSRKKGGHQTTAPIGKQKEAITRYKVLKEFQNYSLLEVSPKTGRMHQIRVHLASIGHPIAGDKKYKFKRQPCPKNLERQFLHAAYLKFKLPDGEIKEFNSKLPEELKKILDELT